MLNHSLKMMILTLTVVCWSVVSYGQTGEGKAAQVKVHVGGPGINHADDYSLKSPATIEQALVQAGGWAGFGEDGMAPGWCLLIQKADGKTVYVKIKIRIDKKTKKVEVTEQIWKDYRLKDGDRIDVPEVLS